MVIGQDWVSSDNLEAGLDDVVKRLGFDPKFPTNRNLDALLERHFGILRCDCYFTNLFGFIKRGNVSANIPMKDLIYSAKEFTLPEIEIVNPRLIICLGLATFGALSRALGRRQPVNMNEAIAEPFEWDKRKICCVAHPGALGMNNRGRGQVDKDWAQLAKQCNIITK